MHLLPDRRKAPCVIYVPGMDQTKEYFPRVMNSLGVSRGMHVISMDGPGQGNSNIQKIRAVADKDKVVILAEAYKKAELLRGEGDAESTRIYAEGFSQDPEFYEFTRSIKAYVETFESKSDMMLIDSNSEFLKYLNKKEVNK